jgi:hypothetical protein
VAYNSTAEAIKKMRMKKMSLDSFMTNDEIQEGTEDLPEEQDEDVATQEKELKEGTDLAPSLKKKPMELEIEMEDGEPMLEEEREIPLRDAEKEMMMQKRGSDQGDASFPVKGMYEPGDENKKGFMGKAAKLMMEKMKKR